ncbi:Hypothetical predicted protein [Pelobates cultripes]|uniref:Uncharacterized protein n=1 Tax=Pelobates cultripes TaxID=61616 RepID=A0AAD1VSP2_PELCU|nr:Hypothetical predicted protein [Pelobates cultripes]
MESGGGRGRHWRAATHSRRGNRNEAPSERSGREQEDSHVTAHSVRKRRDAAGRSAGGLQHLGRRPNRTVNSRNEAGRTADFSAGFGNTGSAALSGRVETSAVHQPSESAPNTFVPTFVSPRISP